MAPALILFTIFRWAPVAYTFRLSLTNYSLIERFSKYVGLSNYSTLFTDQRFINSLLRTLVLTVLSVTLSILLGLVIALLLDKEIKGKSFLQGVFLFPMFVAPIAVGTIWYIMFTPILSPFNYVLNLIGLDSISWLSHSVTAFIAILISDLWMWTPFSFMLLFTGLQTIDPSLYEAAKIDRATSFQMLKFVTLPILSPLIKLTAILRSMDTFRIFDQVFMMTGGGPGHSTETVSMLIYNEAFAFQQIGKASAMVIFLLAIVTIIYFSALKGVYGKEG